MSNPVQGSAALIAALNAANSSVGKTTAVNPNSASAQQDKFLLMLTTQLKNQDPMNPMDNAAITNQMAQLSTVSGINQLNSTLQALSDSMVMGQSVSATSMIGHGVLVPGSAINMASGQAVGGVDVTQPADSLNITIKDKAGNTVRTLNLGAQTTSGVVPFAWDGKTDTGTAAADGTYKFSATSVLSGVTSTPATLSFGTVNSVTPGATGANVSVGALGSFALSSVKQVM
jgi:flagellar basal-body rod modification protein FlgD